MEVGSRGCKNRVRIANIRQVGSLVRLKVVDEEGAVESIPGNEGRIAQAWVKVRGMLQVFALYIGHSEDWTLRDDPLMEAVVKHAATSRDPMLVACDANMDLIDFGRLLVKEECVFIDSACRASGPKRRYYRKGVRLCLGWQKPAGQIKNMRKW